MIVDLINSKQMENARGWREVQFGLTLKTCKGCCCYSGKDIGTSAGKCSQITNRTIYIEEKNQG